MGKKSSGKTYTSKGERRSSIGHKNTNQGIRLLNQLEALEKGKNVRIVLPSLDKNGKQQPATVLMINGREWLKRREGKKEFAE
jgi:hypothetical protein